LKEKQIPFGNDSGGKEWEYTWLTSPFSALAATGRFA
jgi:hypothetical protein